MNRGLKAWQCILHLIYSTSSIHMRRISAWLLSNGCWLCNIFNKLYCEACHRIPLILYMFLSFNSVAKALTHMLNQDETKHTTYTYSYITCSHTCRMCCVHWHSKSFHILSWVHLRFYCGILQWSHRAYPEIRNASANVRRKWEVAIYHSDVFN